MESLPDALVQFILSQMSNAKDIATCNCVSKRWKELLPYIKSLYFPRNLFDDHCGKELPDTVILNMISSVIKLESLVVYTPFSASGLASWLSVAGSSLRDLELRMDSLSETNVPADCLSKIDTIGRAMNLVSLRLWGVQMMLPPKWVEFHNLSSLEIVGARMDDLSLSAALQFCPNLKNLLLLSCEGINSVQISLASLEQCKLDINGTGYGVLSMFCPKIQLLEIQGCSWIKIIETDVLTNLTISNNTGRVSKVELGNLAAVETLSLRGVQWCWEAISIILKLACEVKNLYMKIEFTGNLNDLQPFPEIDFAEFFSSHPRLQKFNLHGAMFAALCQKNSLKNVHSSFTIPSLEELVVTIRSPFNAEQKLCTLESFVQLGKNLRFLVIRILQMKSNQSSVDDFFDEICRFQRMHHRLVRIE